jgi:hypothetical protein
MRGMILLQTPTVFWLDGGHFSQLLNVYWVDVARQTETQTAQSLVPESSAFEPGLLLTS